MRFRAWWHRSVVRPVAGFAGALVLPACLLVFGAGARAATLDVPGAAGVLAYTATAIVVNGLSVSLSNGVYTIDETGESISLGAGALAIGCLAVDPNTVTCPQGAVTGWQVDLLDQADGATLAAIAEPVTLRGGSGNDTLLGGSAGDLFLWLPGDGSDTLDGGPGGDTLDFDGSNGNEIFGITATITGFRATRNIGNVVILGDAIEALSLQTFGGDDAVTTEGLAGTAQSLDGGDQATGTGDSIAYNAHGVCLSQTANAFLSPGGQVVTHAGFETVSVTAPCTGLPSTIDVSAGRLTYTAGVGASNALTASLSAGLYTIDDPSATTVALTAGAIAAGCLTIDLNTVTCPQSAITDWQVDLLDLADVATLTAVVEPVTLRGGSGNDTLLGGSAGDLFLWLPGDGSDTLDGGPGGDTLDFDGSNSNEIFVITATVNGFRATRNVGNVVILGDSIESMSLQTFGGDDSVSTVGLLDTEQSLDGGTHAVADTLVYDDGGSCAELGPSTILTPGLKVVVHVGFETTPVLEPCAPSVPLTSPWSLWALVAALASLGAFALRGTAARPRTPFGPAGA